MWPPSPWRHFLLVVTLFFWCLSSRFFHTRRILSPQRLSSCKARALSSWWWWLVASSSRSLGDVVSSPGAFRLIRWHRVPRSVPLSGGIAITVIVSSVSGCSLLVGASVGASPKFIFPDLLFLGEVGGSSFVRARIWGWVPGWVLSLLSVLGLWFFSWVFSVVQGLMYTQIRLLLVVINVSSPPSEMGCARALRSCLGRAVFCSLALWGHVERACSFWSHVGRGLHRCCCFVVLLN